MKYVKIEIRTLILSCIYFKEWISIHYLTKSKIPIQIEHTVLPYNVLARGWLIHYYRPNPIIQLLTFHSSRKRALHNSQYSKSKPHLFSFKKLLLGFSSHTTENPQFQYTSNPKWQSPKPTTILSQTTIDVSVSSTFLPPTILSLPIIIHQVSFLSELHYTFFGISLSSHAAIVLLVCFFS
jgi:hypothetical protein